MMYVLVCFIACFLTLLICYFAMSTPYRELARLGVVWMGIVALIDFLAWYEEASLWALILMFASPVALIHVGYVLISRWKQQKAKFLENRH